jgi:SAM-dependent methyltransferase
MTLWHDGYLTAIPYPHHVHRELSPSWLVTVLTALGQRPPALREGFSYCELGCGQGLNSLLLAAANPAGRFLAVDYNAHHIEHGRGLAEAAGLANLEFRLASFADLAKEDVQEGFDFIVLHGVYSWVSADNRAAIRRFIQRRLNTGGVLYLAYMSHPGMSAFSGAQRLLWQAAKDAAGSPQDRLRVGFEMLKAWQRGGAGYFVEHPDVARRLARAEEADLAFLAHELLCEHWTPLHSAEVIEEIAALGGQFLGSATPLDNIDALSLPGHCLALLQGIEDPARRETAKDLARNQAQRRDLFQRQAQPLAAEQHRQALLAGCWAALPGAPAGGALQFDTRIGPVQGDGQLFGSLLGALSAGPRSFAELLRQPALAAQPVNLSPALQMLLWAGHAHPLLEGAVAPASCQALNRLLAEGDLQGAGYGHLAAPSLGAPIPASRLEMAAARVLLEHPQLGGQRLRETVLALLRRFGLAAGAPEREQLQAFELGTLPIWRQLGVVGR